ncbi:hypothetical protein GCM10009839_14800 [Catenulispora yoronensis]|uniref:Uncharacterized protein n=2 Tax=Catenulispora yoronensis TaxID=450799 RepID=A0ABN2TSY9_9ACTN
MAAGLLAAAWAFPALTHALRVDEILPLAILLGTASLLRVGRDLLDRLVIAGALSTGLLIAAGMMFTFWPWHLHPVAVAGFSNTVLVVVGVVLHHRHGRLPRLPERVRATDAIILAGPVVTWVLLRRPLRGKSFTDAFPFLMPHHDTANHFSLFDVIHRDGGYPFLRGGVKAPYRFEMSGYPPGAHYLYALLDIFRRSSTDPGAPVGEVVRYSQYEVLGFCLLTLAIPWAARWIAGPSVIGWRRVLITATASAFAVFGQLVTMFQMSFDGEILGLAFLAVTAALMFRPPASVYEQILLAGVLLTAIATVYSMFLINAGIAAIIAFRTRPAIRAAGPARDLLIRVAAVAFAVSAVTVAAGLKLHPLSAMFTERGGFVDLPRGLMIALTIVAVAGVLTRTGRRSPVWRASAVTIGASFAIAVSMELYGRVRSGTPQYYSSKLVESSWVLTLCGIGALGLFLNGQRVSRRAEAALAAASVALPLAVTNGFPMSAHWENHPPQPQATSATVIWSRGHIPATWASLYAAYVRAGGVVADGVPTVFTYGTSHQSYLMTQIATTVSHQVGHVFLLPLDPDTFTSVWMPPGITRVDQPFQLLNRLPDAAPGLPVAADVQAAMDSVKAYLRICPPGTRIAVISKGFAALLQQFAEQEPNLRLSVLYVPGVTAS